MGSQQERNRLFLCICTVTDFPGISGDTCWLLLFCIALASGTQGQINPEGSGVVFNNLCLLRQRWSKRTGLHKAAFIPEVTSSIASRMPLLISRLNMGGICISFPFGVWVFLLVSVVLTVEACSYFYWQSRA